MKDFIKNVVGLNGKWKSPGGRAKQCEGLDCDFVMAWYPGKANSLLFHGKDGERFREGLTNILDSTDIVCAKSSSDSLPSSKRGNSMLTDLSKDLAFNNIQSEISYLSKVLPLNNIQPDVSYSANITPPCNQSRRQSKP